MIHSAWDHSPKRPKSLPMLRKKSGAVNKIPMANLRVWFLISAFRAASSTSSTSIVSSGRMAPYPAFSMAPIISSMVVKLGMYSTWARSVAKLTEAFTTPGTFLFKVLSTVAAQLAQVIPVTGISTVVFATP